ncbi:MAG: FAD-binding oxidoreductase, partial [Sphingomonadaceae bacterium]|nr:FAD-binding oxidoreductase [Sphingomonadaceae bacterium]
IEPVFFWPDAMEELHRRAVEPAHLAKLKGFAANPPARALVDDLRHGVIDIFQREGAAHLQIGRTYPYLDGLDPRARALVGALKDHLDPHHRISPGNLGID